MTPEERSALARQHATSTLKMREFAKLHLSDAEAAGQKREASQWRRQVRELEKLIARYGLERYDQPS